MKKTTIAMSLLVLVMMSSIIIINFNEIVEFASITGLPIMSTRLVILSVENTSCNMSFYEGWNFVSFPCISDPVDIGTFFTQFPEYEYVRHYDADSLGDPWKSYNPSLPSWAVQDLSEFSRADGYWISVNNDSRFYLENELGIPTLMDLKTGWNMIGNPSRDIREFNDSFFTLIPDWDYVLAYNASEPDWKEYTWNTSLPSNQDLNETHPGYGYWIFMLDEDTLVIT